MVIAFKCICGRKLKAQEVHAVDVSSVRTVGRLSQSARLQMILCQNRFSKSIFPRHQLLENHIHRDPERPKNREGLGTPVKVGLVICALVALIAIGVVAWDMAYRISRFRALTAVCGYDEAAEVPAGGPVGENCRRGSPMSTGWNPSIRGIAQSSAALGIGVLIATSPRFTRSENWAIGDSISTMLGMMRPDSGSRRCWWAVAMAANWPRWS